MTIERFPKSSEYFFLSNMYRVGGGLQAEEGLTVPTAEHLYHAAKFTNEFDRLEVYTAEDGYEAKDIAARLAKEGAPVRKDWSPEVKVEVMKGVIGIKFAEETKLADMLLKTGSQRIEEGNTWGDRFWGISPPGSGIGMNMLGRLLMDRREYLRHKKFGGAVIGAQIGSGKSHMVFSDYLYKDDTASK